MSKRTPIFLGLALFLVGVIFGFTSEKIFVDFVCKNRYELINVDLVCSEERTILDKTQYLSLKKRLEVFIKQATDKGDVADVAIYFRDLRYGPTMGIHESDDFAPASLMKTPLALFYFELDERNPGFLARAPRLTFKKDDARPPQALLGENGNVAFTQLFEPAEQLVSGESYSIEDLIYRAIVYSDNDAYFMLVNHAYAEYGTNELLDFLQRLGIITANNDPDNIVSVRGYSSIFRLLYNASLINHEHSEKMLEWLTASTFKQGLVAGVPPEVKVAHKFGEFGLPDKNHFQLHDCGIVYYPENPYLICVMTRGKNIAVLAEIIASISQQVYQEVDSRRL